MLDLIQPGSKGFHVQLRPKRALELLSSAGEQFGFVKYGSRDGWGGRASRAIGVSEGLKVQASVLKELRGALQVRTPLTPVPGVDLHDVQLSPSSTRSVSSNYLLYQDLQSSYPCGALCAGFRADTFKVCGKELTSARWTQLWRPRRRSSSL